MKTFGERLRAAMLAAGKSTPSLARDCMVSRQTVEKWLAMTEPMLSGLHLTRAAHFLRCRLRWLASGVGPIEIFLPEDVSLTDVNLLAKRMSAEALAVWVRIGRLIRDQGTQP